ncbi:hypothetical protein CUT44_28880 [Streptomyces carminius]|uniref:DUF5753 domain-containing protein n=1 Tax=Streptomyces carminius TaxID=2665496 RepID=A0A2M8LQQ0_9ACTN|nr:hypothetical protein CUT44_28880 [Streptomyces carminius]
MLEEAVLHRPCGGPRILRDQLAHLLEAARQRHVEVQILPTAVTDHAAAEGPFTLLEPVGAHATVARTGGRLTTNRTTVRTLQQRYAALRAQAHSPAASRTLVENALGALRAI